MNTPHQGASPIKTIGSLLRKRRESAGTSQRDLAELAGLSVHTISDIEMGKGNPTLDVIGKLSDCLGLELVLQARKIEPDAT